MSMTINKRGFLGFAGAGALLAATGGRASAAEHTASECADPLADLKSMTTGV